MHKIMLFAGLAFVSLTACQEKKPVVSEAAPVQPEAAVAAVEEPEIGWLDADGPGEAAIEWPSTEEGKPGFMISCSQEGSLFRVSLPDPAPATTPTPNEAKALLGFDAVEFPVTVFSSEIVGPHLDGEIPLSPDLLKAIATATRARLSTPAGSFETADDTQGKLAAFVVECAALTGVQPAA